MNQKDLSWDQEEQKRDVDDELAWGFCGTQPESHVGMERSVGFVWILTLL